LRAVDTSSQQYLGDAPTLIIGMIPLLVRFSTVRVQTFSLRDSSFLVISSSLKASSFRYDACCMGGFYPMRNLTVG
jgi:hypothetical protein